MYDLALFYAFSHIYYDFLFGCVGLITNKLFVYLSDIFTKKTFIYYVPSGEGIILVYTFV